MWAGILKQHIMLIYSHVSGVHVFLRVLMQLQSSCLRGWGGLFTLNKTRLIVMTVGVFLTSSLNIPLETRRQLCSIFEWTDRSLCWQRHHLSFGQTQREAHPHVSLRCWQTPTSTEQQERPGPKRWAPKWTGPAHPAEREREEERWKERSEWRMENQT